MSERYTHEIPGFATTFIVDRLRREHSELFGELSVKCGMPGVKTVNGYLSTGDFNFSSVRARQDRAKLLATRAQTNGEMDWFGLLEDFCQRVFEAERAGSPFVDLRTIEEPVIDDHLVEGLSFPKEHPSIMFGDGGTGKSYVALYIAGRLAFNGFHVALFDWELSGGDHRHRLRLLFGDLMPMIHYCRCDRPLTAEADRLQRIVREQKIQYAFYDSIAFACDGRPEDAEIAGRYFRAVRQINCGSLHIAHVNKSEDNDRKPFGSSFWHNGARSTWFVQASEDVTDSRMKLGFFNRKSNMGPIHPAVSLQLTFNSHSTDLRRIDISDSEDFSSKLSVRTRMLLLLRRGSMSALEISQHLDADIETVRRKIRQHKTDFTVLDGGLVSLVERHG